MDEPETNPISGIKFCTTLNTVSAASGNDFMRPKGLAGVDAPHSMRRCLLHNASKDG
jgi:hypothetical protein